MIPIKIGTLGNLTAADKEQIAFTFENSCRVLEGLCAERGIDASTLTLYLNVGDPVPAVLQAKTATPATTSQTITADASYDGLSSVTVSAVTAAIDSDIVATNIKSGVEILGVTGTVTELVGETREVTPSTSEQTITPNEGKNGMTSVLINGVTSAIDSNIAAGNIKSGVSILGVTGSVVELAGETRSVAATTVDQTVTPTEGHNGITSIVIAGVTSAIDANIIAENIKKDVVILGVTGTYEGA